MNWFKLVGHDLRCGLLRLRYLIAALLALIPCLEFRLSLSLAGTTASWMDYILYTFQGNQVNEVKFPFVWLIVVGACLFLNLDYMLFDLTNNGQQVIIRSGRKSEWFLSKCLWNLMGTALYIVLVALVELVFVALSGGILSAENTEEAFLGIFGKVASEPMLLTGGQGLLLGFLLPYLTVAALSLLEMTLCLVVKPILSFLICMAVLVLAICWDSIFALGIGAMTIRSSLVNAQGHDPVVVIVFSIAVIIACVLGGTGIFIKSDILGSKE